MGFEKAHPLVVDGGEVSGNLWLVEPPEDAPVAFSDDVGGRTAAHHLPRGRCHMRRWRGGPAAPDDWTGGQVALRNGSLMPGSAVGYWYHQKDGHDIVSYEAPRREGVAITTLFWLAIALQVAIVVGVILAPHRFNIVNMSGLLATGYAMAAPYVWSGRVHGDRDIRKEAAAG